MYKLSDRCKLLREEAVELKNNMKNYFLQRIVYFSIGGGEAAKKGGLDAPEIFAAGTANVLKNFKSFIFPGEIIVGYNFGDADFGDCYIPKDDEKNRKLMSECIIPYEDIEKYFKTEAKYRDFDYMYGVNLLSADDVELTKFYIFRNIFIFF